MAKKLSSIEKLLKSLPYKNDIDGNPTLKKEFVKNSNYFNDSGLLVNERYATDTFPNIKSREYLQFNNLYNTGFFDDYFARAKKKKEVPKAYTNMPIKSGLFTKLNNCNT